MKILIMNGPNLNMLGVREPEKYGTKTLAEINSEISDYCAEKGIEAEFFQSNYEGALIEKIHSARGIFDGIVLNAGAFTHYSYALRDAIPIVEIPVIEVHLTDITKREDFRKISVISPVCAAQISGYGDKSYIKGIEALERYYDGK